MFAQSSSKGSILLSQRGRTGLAVPRLRLSARAPPNATPVSAAPAPTPSAPRVPAADLSASGAWLARQREGDAEARRSRDKRSRRTRKHSKRSTWREVQRQAPALLAMWGCCGETSSDDDEHNTSNAFLLLCADALIAPVLLAGLADVDELMVALVWRFALGLLLLTTTH